METLWTLFLFYNSIQEFHWNFRIIERKKCFIPAVRNDILRNVADTVGYRWLNVDRLLPSQEIWVTLTIGDLFTNVKIFAVIVGQFHFRPVTKWLLISNLWLKVSEEELKLDRSGLFSGRAGFYIFSAETSFCLITLDTESHNCKGKFLYCRTSRTFLLTNFIINIVRQRFSSTCAVQAAGFTPPPQPRL